VDERARSGDFDVRTASLCPWIAWSNADWITITDGHLGIGPGEVEYRVDRNPSRSGRTGTITAAGETFTIRQRGDDDD
jgi:hypothetical protein